MIILGQLLVFINSKWDTLLETHENLHTFISGRQSCYFYPMLFNYFNNYCFQWQYLLFYLLDWIEGDKFLNTRRYTMKFSFLLGSIMEIMSILDSNKIGNAGFTKLAKIFPGPEQKLEYNLEIINTIEHIRNHNCHDRLWFQHQSCSIMCICRRIILCFPCSIYHKIRRYV